MFQSFIKPQIILVQLLNHARIRSLNQPAISKKVKFLAQGNNAILWWLVTYF